MSAVEKLPEAANTAISSLCCEHLLHIFPSFGIGGVPLRIVRVINHFGKRFRHTVIALDDNFEAAAGIAGDLAVRLVPMRYPTRGTLYVIARNALALRRLRPN